MQQTCTKQTQNIIIKALKIKLRFKSTYSKDRVKMTWTTSTTNHME